MSSSNGSGIKHRLQTAKARLLEQQAEREAHETREAAAVADAAEHASQVTKIELERVQYARDVELASNQFHHTYSFTGSVDGKSVGHCIHTLSTWHRLDEASGKKELSPITIVFTSPGGDIIQGMALFDFICNLRAKGHHVTTEAMGYAASMAGILLQTGDKRVMNPQSWLLIHQASFNVGGSYGAIEDRVKWVKKVQDRILDIFAERCKTSKAKKPLKRDEIARRWERTDWWLSSEEALEGGLVDSIKGTL